MKEFLLSLKKRLPTIGLIAYIVLWLCCCCVFAEQAAQPQSIFLSLSDPSPSGDSSQIIQNRTVRRILTSSVSNDDDKTSFLSDLDPHGTAASIAAKERPERGRVVRQNSQKSSNDYIASAKKQATDQAAGSKQQNPQTRMIYPTHAQLSCYTCSDCRSAGQPTRCPRSLVKPPTNNTTTPSTAASRRQQKEQEAAAQAAMTVGCAKILIDYPGERRPSIRKKCLDMSEAPYCGASIVHPLTSVTHTFLCCFDSLCNQANSPVIPVRTTLSMSLLVVVTTRLVT